MANVGDFDADGITGLAIQHVLTVKHDPLVVLPDDPGQRVQRAVASTARRTAGSTARGGFLWSGAASLALGLLIVFEWPGSSGWAIGTLVGAAVLFSGITRTVISATIHEEAHKLNEQVRAA